MWLELFYRLLHGPDTQWTHVAERSVLSVVEVGLGCLEGKSVTFVAGVVAAVRCLPSFLNKALDKRSEHDKWTFSKPLMLGTKMLHMLIHFMLFFISNRFIFIRIIECMTYTQIHSYALQAAPLRSVRHYPCSHVVVSHN